jgi:hypothetical protein
VGEQAKASVLVIGQLGPDDRNSKPIGTRAVGAIYDVFLHSILPHKGWFGIEARHTDAEHAQQQYLANKGLEVLGALKKGKYSYADEDDAKRVAFMVIMSQKGDPLSQKKRLTVSGWKGITAQDLQSVYGGRVK